MSRYLLCFCDPKDEFQFPSKSVGIKWLSEDLVVRVLEWRETTKLLRACFE